MHGLLFFSEELGIRSEELRGTFVPNVNKVVVTRSLALLRKEEGGPRSGGRS